MTSASTSTAPDTAALAAERRAARKELTGLDVEEAQTLDDADTAAFRENDLYRYIPDIVKNAMLTMWNYICDDTKCHPLDIEHGRGKFLTFQPKHWAQFAGEMAERNIRDLFATQASPNREEAADTGAVREALRMVTGCLKDILAFCEGEFPSAVEQYDGFVSASNAIEWADVALSTSAPAQAEEGKALEVLKAITVFQGEEEDCTNVVICGVKFRPCKNGTPAARALLKFDALQRAALSSTEGGSK